MLVFVIVISLFAGCSSCEDSSESIYDLVLENGQYYIVPREPLPPYPQIHDAFVDGTSYGVNFDSIAQMKQAIETGNFDENELRNISRFETVEDGKIPICDLSDLYAPLVPESFVTDYVFWEGTSYTCWFDETDDVAICQFELISAEQFEEERERLENLEKNSKATLLSVSEEPERNAKVFTYSGLLERKTVDVVYTIKRESKTLLIREHYSGPSEEVSDTPESIVIYGVHNGDYFMAVVSRPKERPSVEWLSAFGVTGYKS